MAWVWSEADNGVAAKPIAKPVHELCQTLRTCCFGIKTDPGLRRRQRIDDECAQRHHLNAVTGIEAVQLLQEQPPQMTWRASRPAGAHGDPRHRAICTKGGKFQPSRPLVRCLQAGANLY